MDGGFSFLRGRRSVETPAKSAASALARPPAPTLIKVGLLGDTLVGKTSLMARFVEGTFDEISREVDRFFGAAQVPVPDVSEQAQLLVKYEAVGGHRRST